MQSSYISGQSLMPPGFQLGLSSWSQQNGRPGDPDWSTAHNALVVSSDIDFGNCLEIQKQKTTTSLRFEAETPIRPGRYLRVSCRIKQVAGPFCSVRIAGWAGDSKKNHIEGVAETGPDVALTGYHRVDEVSAIVGVGQRPGVDMSWGTTARFGHLGLDLIGANGGTVRIENLKIEDVTGLFIPALIDWVDVRDFGAAGDNVSNDRAAFLAADFAANGGGILVPPGQYRIEGGLSIKAPIRFQGTLNVPAADRVVFLRSFDFPTYAAAFGDETLAMKKALQALLGFTDHVTLDLAGRRVDLKEPLHLNELAPELIKYSTRRTIRNGSIQVVDGPAWETRRASSAARYDPADPRVLHEVANIGEIEIGSRVIADGVGREVYVNGRDLAGGKLFLSNPLYGGPMTQVFRFERYRYAFDFSGVERVDHFNFADIDFNCNGFGSAIMLPPMGRINALRDCSIYRPKDRGITSIGRGCQGLLVDQCQFVSSDSGLLAHERTTVAININANDSKIRNNRFERFGHFMVANGAGHTIIGNHWFQGDSSESKGPRSAGLILTQLNPQVNIVGNYIDNATVEWTNEHDPRPARGGNDHPFGGLTVTGNTFLASHIVPWFSWLIIKPFGPGQYIDGLTVTSNVFKAYAGEVERPERVDTSLASLDRGAMRNIRFEGNTYTGVAIQTSNPLNVILDQRTAATSWTSAVSERLPFDGEAMIVKSIVPLTPITDSTGQPVGDMPWAQTRVGPARRQLRLHWTRAVKGKALALLRMDQVV